MGVNGLVVVTPAASYVQTDTSSKVRTPLADLQGEGYDALLARFLTVVSGWLWLGAALQSIAGHQGGWNVVQRQWDCGDRDQRPVLARQQMVQGSNSKGHFHCL